MTLPSKSNATTGWTSKLSYLEMLNIVACFSGHLLFVEYVLQRLGPRLLEDNDSLPVLLLTRFLGAVDDVVSAITLGEEVRRVVDDVVLFVLLADQLLVVGEAEVLIHGFPLGVLAPKLRVVATLGAG